MKLWRIQRTCALFREKYDTIQEQLQSISCMDDLLSGKLRHKNLHIVNYNLSHNIGMLSKSKGQILRIAATLHVLFNMNDPLAIPTVISETAIKAAINLVDVCLQDAAFLAGRGDIGETIEKMITGTH